MTNRGSFMSTEVDEAATPRSSGLATGVAESAHSSRDYKFKRPLAALAAILLAVVPCIDVAPIARADDRQYEEFYTPPDPLPPGAPGDLIRTEPSRLVLEPSGQLGMIMADATRIMYRSNDVHGNPMAVTGTYFEPHNDWPGGGPPSWRRRTRRS